jgi:hypothetical protein
MPRLSTEARDELYRAFLAVLRAKHPGMIWKINDMNENGRL